MNHIVNTTLNTITRAKFSTITPALVIALGAGIAAPVIAQDSNEEPGAFGLLEGFTQQAEQASEPVEYDEVQGQNNGDFGDEEISDLAGEIEVSEYDLVDLHVNNEDLGNILQLLSIQSQRNIISSNTVHATVTADLYGVTFYEALDSILNVNGFGYIEKGNFIYVYTREELEEFERASRRPISRILHLDYLNSADAAEFAKEMLSDSGSISTHAATEAFSISDGAPAGADTYASSASIVIHDFEEHVEEIITLLEELDTKPAQILVEATILQTALNEANAFGVDFALIKNLNFSDFVGTGGPLSVIDGLIGGAGQDVAGTDIAVPNGTSSDAGGVSSSVGNTAGPATLKAGLVNGDVAVFLRVLDEVTDVTIVSNPKMLTLNRQPARVLVGTKVGYLNTTSTETSTTQSVEFLDTGTQLNVRPFVSADGVIRMELMPQVSSFRLRNVTDATGSTVTIPDEDTSELVTNVMVRDGQTVVLGGLFTETTSASRRQVPGLGDIPVIRAAFRGHDDETRRSEIIFMITPSIVNDTMMADAGNRATDYMNYTRSGARKGTLIWGRERRISRLLQEAEDAVIAGDRELALSNARWALELHPQNTSARRLLDQLSQYRPGNSGSSLEDILHHELDLPAGSVLAPNTNAQFINPQAMSINTGEGGETGQVTDWLLSEGESTASNDSRTDDDSFGTPFVDSYQEEAFVADQSSNTDSYTANAGSTSFDSSAVNSEFASEIRDLSPEELELRQSSPQVFMPEQEWLPDQAQWKPKPGDYFVNDQGQLVEFAGDAESNETAQVVEPAEPTDTDNDPEGVFFDTEFAEVEDESLSMNETTEPDDFSTGWGEDEFTAAFGDDVEQQPWFFPIHGGLVWVPIPRGFFPAEQADSFFGETEQEITTVPTESGEIDE